MSFEQPLDDKSLLQNSQTIDQQISSLSDMEESNQAQKREVATEDLPRKSIRTGNYFSCHLFSLYFSEILVCLGDIIDFLSKSYWQLSNMILRCFSSIDSLAKILKNGQTYFKIKA